MKANKLNKTNGSSIVWKRIQSVKRYKKNLGERKKAVGNVSKMIL